MTIEKLYKMREVAEICSLSIYTLKDWVKAERVKSVKLGKARRIPESEVKRIQEGGVK